MPTHNNTFPSNQEVEKVDSSDEYRAMLQAHVLGRLYAEHKELLEKIKATFSPGESRSAQNPQGVKMGSYSMSQPSKKAVCEDPAILAAMAEDNNLEIVDVLPRDKDRLQELLNHVYETRPDLLDISISKDDEKELAKQVLKNWQVKGEIPAGWKIADSSAPTFRTTKARSEDALAVVDHLFGQAADILQLPNGKAS